MTNDQIDREIALEIDGAVKIYKSGKRTVTAVGGVSLTVNGGEVFGLLGMNGAGKSTLIKLCTGAVEPSGGSVRVFGRAVNDIEAKKLFNVSPQETAVAPALTVGENLELVARIYGADKTAATEAAKNVAERLKLTDRYNDRAAKLSGGLMRRLSIGMAVVTSPRLVFLDEPTLGLDVVARRELWKIIREISASTAVVLTTHYLEEAEALCGRIAIMSKGVISAVGTVDELKKQSGEDSFENAFLRLAGEEYAD